eukprot:TRINITY_DN11165_c0_g1_i1.p1 TRINITY_DN11165_c0_g1~~TRINITY_DN11165_c0_g1_i1.p1  ORF type:complete len:124 (-),score=21.71 TRINITY_DN11165_c0_g1_i1:287-658(-)
MCIRDRSQWYHTNQSAVHGDPADCLESAQKDPYQPGRTDPLVNGCPVCNQSLPCLFDLLTDPGEKRNLASEFPEIVRSLAGPIKRWEEYYVTGHLSEAELEKYTPVADGHWGGFTGPCYLGKV